MDRPAGFSALFRAFKSAGDLAGPSQRPCFTSDWRRFSGLPRWHRVLAAVVIEAALGLAAEPASFDVFHQERAGAVLRIGEPFVQNLHDGETGVEADEIGELKR